MRISNSPLGKTALALSLAAVVTAGAMTTTMSPAIAAVPAGGYVDLVQQVSPAVVSIEVETKREGKRDKMSRDGALPFDEFSRRFDQGEGVHGRSHGERGARNNDQQGERHGAGKHGRGAGSGFIIDSDGVIVTNAHVVKRADKVTVTLKDGRKFIASVVGRDRATDLAVLKVDATDLPSLDFGDSDALLVGAPVVAVGNPFGLGQTVTSGIVSALGRDIKSGPFDNFIQTDAAINRGNSGGPLLNEQGQVVGINTAILSPTGGSVGLGFAVPSDLAQDVVADLQEDGKVDRGYLGVAIKRLNDDVVAALGLADDTDGVMIAQVGADTAAEKAGLHKGDIVLGIGGDTVKSPRELTRLIGSMEPGTQVTLNILRAGEKMDLTVELANRADRKT